MFQKILFAVADDNASEAAVPVVGAYARQLGADVHVLHVHRVGEDPGNGELRRMLLSVQKRLQAEGIQAGGEVRLARSSGGIATVIARAAAEIGGQSWWPSSPAAARTWEASSWGPSAIGLLRGSSSQYSSFAPLPASARRPGRCS
jgi:nucleotide-binding universal stress UspA family protein